MRINDKIYSFNVLRKDGWKFKKKTKTQRSCWEHPKHGTVATFRDALRILYR